MAVSIVEMSTGARTVSATVSATLAAVPEPDDLIILLATTSATQNFDATEVNGCDATWERVPDTSTRTDTTRTLDLWVGRGAKVAGEITAIYTGLPGTNYRQARAWLVRGAVSTVTGAAMVAPSGPSATLPSQTVPAGGLIIAAGYADAEARAISATTPVAGWTIDAGMTVQTARWARSATRTPTAAEPHSITATRSGHCAVNAVVLAPASTTPGVPVDLTGLPVALDATTPAGTIAAGATLTGKPTGLTIATPAGIVEAGGGTGPVDLTGQPVALTIATPAGNVSAPVTLTGEPAGLTIGTPRGIVSVAGTDELEATSHTRVRTTLADSVDVEYLTATSRTTVTTSAALSLDVTINPSTKRPDYTLLLVDREGWPIAELDKARLGLITRTRNGNGSFSFSLDKDDPKLAHVRQFSEVQVRIGSQLVPGGWFVITDPAIDNGREWKFQCAGLRWHLESRRIGKELPELLRNGDFTQGEKYWHPKWFKGSAAEAPPDTRIVTGDKAMEGGKALEVTGVERVSKQSIQSNAIFLANRPFAGEDLDNGFVSGGKKVITDAIKKIAKGSAMVVEGHTADADAGDGYALSVRRAEAAKAVILKARPDLKVTAIGKGETEQVAPNNTEANQAKNRRLVIIATITSIGHRQAVTQRITYTQPKSARRPMELLLDARVNLIDYVGPSKDGWLLYIDRRRASKPKEINDASHTTIAEDFPVERWTTDGTSINVPFDGQPWIFEVRLYPTAGKTRFDQISLRPNIYTAWYGITRPEAIRNLVRHAQDPEFHKADLNITTNCKPSGVRADFEYAWLDRRTVDDAISEELRSDTSPDFEIVVTDHRRIATTWANRGRRTHVPLKLGDIVTDYTSGLDGDKVASTAILQASRERGSKGEAIARTTRADGLVLERLFDAEQGSADAVLRAQARAALRYGRTDVIRSVTCDPERTIWLMERINLGDICPVQVDDGGLDGNGDYRIESITLDPGRHQLTYQLAVEGA